MVLTVDPKRVPDATRFTATTPHAASNPQSNSRFSPTPARQRPAHAPPRGTAAVSGTAGGMAIETPEQRVMRLRAAHLAAKNAQISRFDKIVDGGRRFFDTLHKVTIMGLVGFSIVASLGTAYTVFDMMSHNHKRKDEFIALQLDLEADSLEAARLAYMRGDATEEQTEMVEDAIERERSGENRTTIFKVPEFLSAPKPLDEPTAAAGGAEGALVETVGKKKSDYREEGLWKRLFGGGKKAASSEGEAAATATTLNLDEKYAMVKERARLAFEEEKKNQSTGGMFDRIGAAVPPQPPKV